MMGDWTPEPDRLEDVVNLVRMAGSQVHSQEVIVKLQEYEEWSDFSLYLCFIFVYLESEREEVRTMAGIVLKKNVEKRWTNIPEVNRHYIKNQVIHLLASPSNFLREICGNVITVILGHTKPSGWPDIMQLLCQYLDSDQPLVLQGTFATLHRICEDHCRELVNDTMNRPLDNLIPKLIRLLGHQEHHVKWFSLRCLLHLISWMPPSLLMNINDFLKYLFMLADNPPSVQVLDVICRSFCALVASGISAINEFMDGIVDYMINMTAFGDAKIALTASDFWTTIAETDLCYSALVNKLPSLIPVLLSNLRFSQEELYEMGEIEEPNAQIPDRSEDVYPSWGKQDNMGRFDSNMDSPQWTLRKSCGLALDDLSHCFTTELLQVLFPLCQNGLSSVEWLDREASILALGAVSADVIAYSANVLPQLIPILLQLIDDRHPLIRSIACWTTSRYAHWITSAGVSNEFLQPAVLVLLNHLPDGHKQVSESAGSALSVLCDESQELMVPFMQPMVQTIMKAYPMLHRRGLLVIYDAIGSLAEAVKEELNQEDTIEALMPPLIDRWNELQDDDPDLVPLIDCISRIATSLGVGFSPFAQPVFQRGMQIAQNVLVMQNLAHNEPDKYDDPDLRFLVSALELLSSIVSSFGSGISELVANSNIVDVLTQTSDAPLYQVRRASFMLVGDLAKVCVAHIRVGLDKIIPNLVSNIRHAVHVSVPNNALWATGEIALAIGDAISPWASDIVTRSTKILQDPVLHPNIHQNAAILLGRLAIGCPMQVAEQMEQFMKPWCIILCDLEDNDDKKSAFDGLMAAVKVNPSATLREFSRFADACASWSYHYSELKTTISAILHEYKIQLGEKSWEQLWNSLQRDTQDILRNEYRI